ncbi:catechol-2,3-dioxygenase [Erwinia toletana]|uniref:Catechol-2,3-dioxygenase n=1 Tax=Winslowiella toletana TaxID=92490 RepID=A0ABS4PBQ9_9GAMM|nr:VOC family protein [Winslowiella toletana]MBP2170071.1 catechol-2,3-dioxygenase [Winslowiella toletana]
MTIQLSAFDHVHIYVDDIQQATRWYHEVLGFSVCQPLLNWYQQGGPLTLQQGNIHLALFKRQQHAAGHTVAFRCNAAQFIAAQRHLSQHDVTFSLSDHQLSWSIYFSDPFANRYEITSYEYAALQP